ncbi:MAG: hypothetical protein HKN87_13665 [Saprospiraceae bacterium]|nr:hypothetical protein [Saprospiraceae bacterium]
MMKKYHIYMCLTVGFLAAHCSRQVNLDQDMSEPSFVELDTVYKNVFLPLDGIWQGTFYIYTNPKGQQNDKVKGEDLETYFTSSRDGWLQDSVQVRQVYESTSPYFQKVTITDSYTENGNTTHVTAMGVNKVQQGLMWCVVQKPDEKIVHLGKLDDEHTIIWSRNVDDPLRKEYFKETVSSDSYEIWGYGYYGEDKTHLLPKTWFSAKYHRISDYLR